MVVLCACYFVCWWPSKGKSQLFGVITGASIANTVTQRSTSFHYRWYLCLLHWIIQSSIHLIFPRFFNSHPDLHRTLPAVTGDLIAKTVTQIVMIFHHRWYLFLLNLMIWSLIHLSCSRFVNSHLYLHITQRRSRKLLQYLFRLQLVRQIPCHHRPPRMEVAIFMDAWLMFLSWHPHNDNSML